MKVLITGGAGFIGTNVAIYYLKKGHDVSIIDNLGRKGSQENLNHTRKIAGDEGAKIQFWNINMEDAPHVNAVMKSVDPDVVIHLAAQVAVTTSVTNPRDDMLTNIVGTFNLLEAIRQYSPDTIVIYASTNKVLGDLDSIKTEKVGTQYAISDRKYKDGFGVSLGYNPCTPYGVSKFTAQAYMQDYAKMYGLKTMSFIQSCIYGPFQRPMSDQGWIAFFAESIMKGKPFTIFGDGFQVRDALYVDDLVSAYDKGIQLLMKYPTVTGKAITIGGGTDNKISVIETIHYLEKKIGKQAIFDYKDWRPKDQKVFISDNTDVRKLLGWNPKMMVTKGIDKMLSWQQSVL